MSLRRDKAEVSVVRLAAAPSDRRTVFGAGDTVANAEPGTIEMDVTINVFTRTERLKGAFTQTMPVK